MGTEITADIEVEEGFDTDAKIARQVLSETLGDGFSREDEDYHASAWESSHGEPLKRAWESWPEFRARRDVFKSTRKPKTYFMDVPSAQQSLGRLRRKDVLTESDVNEIHALEDMLEVTRTDVAALYTKKDVAVRKREGEKPERETVYFKKLTKDMSDEQSLDHFNKIQTAATWADRIKLVHAETDLGALHLVVVRETREEVREAAEQRVMELEISSR